MQQNENAEEAQENETPEDAPQDEAAEEAPEPEQAEEATENDAEMEELRARVAKVKEFLESEGCPFPQDVTEQLKGAVGAILASWKSP